MVSWDNGGSLSVAWGEDWVRRMDLPTLTIAFDPYDLDAMRELMRQHEKYQQGMLTGDNENGESTSMSIQPEKITVVTLQENGWIRRNIYHYDGTREELYDGKWN